eukprot:7273354-Pyramimonas_sp.AAC.1
MHTRETSEVVRLYRCPSTVTSTGGVRRWEYDCSYVKTVGLWDCGAMGLWDCGTVGLWDCGT